MYHVQKTEAVV